MRRARTISRSQATFSSRLVPRRLVVASLLGAGLTAFATVAAAQTSGTVPAEALELRNLGLAQLENEKPAEAEATFRRLTQLYQTDPLGPANLAIALLRQQRAGEALLMIQRALQMAPARADLDAIRGDILAWQSDAETALAAYRQAAANAPDDPIVQYALYRHASSAMRGEAADAAAGEALERLRRLRPENLVVLLERANRAIAAADRAAASDALLRVRELLFQAPTVAAELGQALEALEAGDAAKARVPALRLTNLLKSTPMFRGSLVELSIGIQGNPVARFAAEPPSASFGEPVPVRFVARTVDAAATSAIVAADLDSDELPDLARLVGSDGARALEVRLTQSSAAPSRLPAGRADRLLLVDLDNDGTLDLLGFGDGELHAWRGGEGGRFAEATPAFGLQGTAAHALATLDFDSEGDLDLLVVAGTPPAAKLHRNTLEGPLQDLGGAPLPALERTPATGALAADLDRDGDTDVLLWGERGAVLLENLRQGRFHDRTAGAGLDGLGPVATAAAADLDNDGRPELLLGGPQGLRVLRERSGRYQPVAHQPPVRGAVEAVVTADLDNDGRLDLAVAAGGQVQVFAQRGESWAAMAVEGEAGRTGGVEAIAATDLDRDGDLDLLAGGASGLVELRNDGGNRNHWLRVTLRGLTTGNDKNNTFGRGASIEVFAAGGGYQFREVTEPVTHFGLGRHRCVENLRVVWNNGVPQNRLQPCGEQLLVEEQVLKGSCPFLYTWNGEELVFVTDLLWGAPLGMPVGEGIYAGADPVELVRVDGARPREGVYDLRITEELWEAAYFDHLRLWVVDHPDDTEAASSLRVFAGPAPPGGNDDHVLVTGEVRPVARAWDGRGRDVTARVAARDEVYADGYQVSDYQGIAAAPWTFTFDLGAAPAEPVRLLLDGWIFPADASLNVASAQRGDLTLVATRLEVETPAGWQPLLDPMGFPPGKTKTMVVDTPRLPAGAARLRIVSTQWLHWDRIAWSASPRDAEARVVAQLLPRSAELRYGGFSKVSRRAPNAPHHFDYARRAQDSPWLPMAGPYTRYGEVVELLRGADDRLVVMGAGDEIAVAFDATTLPPVPAGFARTLFLESHGWDKDADRNTWRGDETGPMPFRAMSGYPYTEPYPDRAELERWRAEWLTRETSAPVPDLPAAAISPRR